MEVNFCKNAGSKTPQMNFENSVFGKSTFFRSHFTLKVEVSMFFATFTFHGKNMKEGRISMWRGVDKFGKVDTLNLQRNLVKILRH